MGLTKPHGSAPRATTLAAASLLVLLAVAAVAVGVAMGSLVGTPDPTKTYSPARNIDAAPGMDVPMCEGCQLRRHGQCWSARD